SLNDIVNCAIAAAGKHGVAPFRHRAAGVVGCFLAGAANRKFSADAGRLDDANGMVQFHVAPWAARVGIEENGGFAHASASSALSLAHTALPHADEISRRLRPRPVCTMLARKVLGRSF